MPLIISTAGCDDVYGSGPSRVGVMHGCAIPMQISLPGWGGGEVFRAIITQISVQRRGGFQFMHTLSDFIYLYTFTERIGQLNIGGITFSDGCGGSGSSGFDAVMAYYEINRATASIIPIAVSVGSIGFSAFLMGMSSAIFNPELGLGSFSFQLFFPPG